jgi:hypothetical protein
MTLLTRRLGKRDFGGLFPLGAANGGLVVVDRASVEAGPDVARVVAHERPSLG